MVLQVTSLAPEMLNRCATPRALPTRKFAVPYCLAHHVYRIHNSAGEDHLGDALHEELAHVLGVGRDSVHVTQGCPAQGEHPSST